MRELCSGRIPQNAILSRARIDPTAVIGDRDAANPYGEEFFMCPPNVPLFTTSQALQQMQAPGGINANGKRGRSTGEETMIPVIAHIPTMAEMGTRSLIFVGISYNGGSRSRPVVSVATGGQMPLSHEETRDTAHVLVGIDCWWARSTETYGSYSKLHIAVPKTMRTINAAAAAAAAGAGVVGMFTPARTRALCGITVQQATDMDCAVLLGVPPFA